jgi:hypothetical protein
LEIIKKNVIIETEKVLSLVKWWESKRWIFNLLVGISGIYGIYGGLRDWPDNSFVSSDLIGIILWGIFANILYSTGMVVEILEQYYFKGKLKLIRLRLIFLIIGTLLYCFITWFNAWKYYAMFELW